MFISKLKMPTGVSDYEYHQHLHHQFEGEERQFLYRVQGDTVKMLSIVPPKCPSTELKLGSLRPNYPLPFQARLVITRQPMKGKREDVRCPHKRMDWLKRQLDDRADVLFARFNDNWITLGNGTRRLVADVTGTLNVTNTARFAALLQAGMGRSKAFGCGLLWMPEVME